MCLGCYEEYDSPNERCALTDYAVSLIREVYRHNAVGGNLHVVLDDWNIDDDVLERAPSYFSDSVLPVERECLAVLQGMTLEQRATALAIHDGFLP